MIRKSVLHARAAQGYRWLQEKGPYFGLDVGLLQLRPELLDVSDEDWCPLSHADAEPAPADGYLMDGHYFTICDRLGVGRQVPGTSKFIRIYDVAEFVVEHGFDIDDEARWYHGRRWIGTWGFRPGSDRDWRLLSQAWSDVLATNTSKVTV